MDFSLLIFSAIFIGYIGALVYIANQDDAERSRRVSPPETVYDSQRAAREQRITIIRWMLYGVAAMTFVFALLVLYIALLSNAVDTLGPEAADMLQELNAELPPVDTGGALVNLILAAAVSTVAFRVVISGATRQRIKVMVGDSGAYNPDSSVHNVALVLGLSYLSVTVGQLVMFGGLAGLAQDIDVSGVSLTALVFQGVLFVALAFLGVGFAIRRTGPDSLKRLGLRLPTIQDVTWGVGMGLGLYGALIVMALIWQVFLSPEQFAEQSAASEALAEAFGTFRLAFLLSITAAVSEEILFRGALQPVFGMIPTSLFFALVHMQYTLTPATIIIFVVSIGLAWLRQRQSTTAAIIAHFVYNFIQLTLAIMAAGALQGG